MYIYILQLQDNHYYIGKTSSKDPHNRISQHFNGTGAVWTTKYKPIKIIELLNNCNKFDEDKYTKMYMDKYGIDNVRGGSYCKVTLTKTEIFLIEKEILSCNNKCYNCGLVGHLIKDCPSTKQIYDRNDDNIRTFSKVDIDCIFSDDDY